MPRRNRSTFRLTKWIDEMEFQPYPDIIEYTAILMDGRKIKNRMDMLHRLETNIYDLRVLILRFTNPQYNSHYYPYSVHNVVLEKISNFFVPYFYHYYNVNNERIDIPIQQQYYDFCAVEQLLFQRPILYYAIYTHMMRPSFLYYQSPFSSPITDTNTVNTVPFYLDSNSQEKMIPNEAIS